MRGPADLRSGADVRPYLFQSALYQESERISELLGRKICGQARTSRRHRRDPEEDGRVARARRQALFCLPRKRPGSFLAAGGGGKPIGRAGRSILPRAGEPPNLFLIELEHAARQPELMPALILFGPDGKYTQKAEAVFTGPKTRPAGSGSSEATIRSMAERPGAVLLRNILKGKRFSVDS